MSNVCHAAGWNGGRRADNVALAPRISEDWLSLIIGLLIFALALAGLGNGLGVALLLTLLVANQIFPVA
jgi:hypothetical protein